MKVVKLNRRYKQFVENRHTVGIRFPQYGQSAGKLENVCRRVLKTSGYDRTSNWYSYFGHRDRYSGGRPYWFTFRNESDLTIVLLSADLTTKGSV